MSTKLNDTLIRILCIENSKTRSPNEANGTNTRITHAVNKLNCINSKLYQALDSIKGLFNIEAGNETSAHAVMIDEPIRGFDESDINVGLEQSISTLDHTVDELIQIIDESKQDADKSKQAVHKLTDAMILFEKMIDELSSSTQDTGPLKQLKQSVDDLTHVARQLTRAIDVSELSQSQCFY
jgi:hypothetical protein